MPHALDLGIVERASDSTIQRVLKKMLKPHQSRYWMIPPRADAVELHAKVSQLVAALH